MDINQKINEVFVDSLQEMGFVDVIPSNDHSKNLEQPISVKINILMPYLHDIIISFDQSLAKEIARNIHGDDNFESKILDSLGEFANIFSGKIFEKLAPKLLFELGYPEPIVLSTINRNKYIIQRFVTPDGALVEFYRKFNELPSK